MTEEALFERAAQLAAGERGAFLDRECPDPALRARVEALLAADAASHSPFDGPVESTRTLGDPAATGSYRPAASAEEAEGAVIAGRYKLRQRIGEGGMGTVWMADQTVPVKRRVAVKLIRTDRGNSRTILSRFEAERQAIALMDHPHIARLLDAGTTDTGAPFFVMELVKGVPLSDYCDQHRLTIAERLNLFQQICSAVQHAHQKGVIHRDLKPSNILVESHDGRPVPKVIDFGLAKATTGLQLTDQSMFTAFGSVMGTPLYMAPEQAAFNAVDVDTRADVYALGVVLYELLTGTTPLTKETLKKAALDEMLRLIREQEPPTPSSRLSSADSTPGVAASRQTEPAKLGRFVKGELDWIVLKALSKDRDRRYETASGFARDVERFLNHEPVTAGPPSASYRLKKFVRRNRPQVIAASLVLLALMAGVVGTTVGLLEARRSADRERLAKLDAEDKRAEAEHAAAAEKAAKEAETVAKLEAERKRQEAERNLAFATKGNDILGSVFAGLDPKKSYPSVGEFSQALTENLRKAVRELDGTAIGDPLVVAQMQQTLGLSLLALGDSASAIIVFEKARDTRRELLGPDDVATLASLNNLASAYRDAGRLDRALPLLEEVYRLTKANLGLTHADTLACMNNLAGAYQAAGKLNLAVPLLEEAIGLTKKHINPDHSIVIVTMNNLALAYQEANKPDQAVPLFAEAHRRQTAKYGPDHPDTFTSANNLALGHLLAGQRHEALKLYEETLKLRKARLGPEHPDTLWSMSNLADFHRMAGEHEVALPLYEETLRIRKAKLGADHPDTLASMNGLASAYKLAGKIDLALPIMEQTFQLRVVAL